MKVILITPTPPDISAFGVRSISAYLRKQGCTTTVVFLPGSIGLLQEGGAFVYRYSKQNIDQILELCCDADLIGVSFMTSYFDRACQITRGIKNELTAPVIWGGIHPSTRPLEALQHTDMVCIGEGEKTIHELLQRIEDGRDYRNVQGLWLKEGAEIVRNRLRPLIDDLDQLPQFDFSNENHYVLNHASGRIEPLTDELFSRIMPRVPSRNGTLKRAYRTITDRGCPHHCSYCNISTLKDIYKGSGGSFLRSRRVENVISELVHIRNRFPFVEVIQFFDDTFFARPLKYIRHFAEVYKAEVGLPFYCQASPLTLSRDKLEALLGAGLIYVEMGIQTGSERTRKLYRRTETNAQILEGAKLLNHYRDRLISPDYHIIIDNPWETDQDLLATLKLLHQLPKPYGLCISSLVFFPGTALYEKALAEGIVQDELSEVYRKPFYVPPQRTYLSFLIYLFTFQHIPKRLIGFLMHDKMIGVVQGRNLGPFYQTLYSAGEACRLIVKGLNALLNKDWERLSLFFKGLRLRDPVAAGRKK